jgi:preprotein translocase subunit SecB
MTVKSSPLRLENLIISKEKIEAYPEYCGEERKTPAVDFSVKFGEAEIQQGETLQRFDAIFFTLKVNAKKRKVPFKAEVEGFALFSTDVEEEQQKAKLLVYNGTVIVFGFLRGYLYAKLGVLNPECRLIPSADIRGVIEKALTENSEGSE